MSFAKWESGKPSLNDFLVVEEANAGPNDDGAQPISEVLLEQLAHQRSLIFGLALANRFVNVMLPHALLAPPETAKRSLGAAKSGSWILQPLISLIRDARDPLDFRRTYSLTVFLIPIKKSGYRARKMPACEIDRMVNAGWNIASSPPTAKLPLFDVHGPLPGYLSRLARFPLSSLLRSQEESQQRRDVAVDANYRRVTLRQTIEIAAFAVALKMTQGTTGHLDDQATRQIGEAVVTSLGSGRVSSVLVIDKTLRKDVCGQRRRRPPEQLSCLMESLASEARIPPRWNADEWHRYRLDRPFFDKNTYAVGVLPENRCLVTTTWCRKSGLTEVGKLAYMTIGAATAIGTIRAIDRDLEKLEDADPTKIAEIEGEIAADLHEIYDLDITHETYRHLYHLLRRSLGITEDYNTLQNKMDALDRETTTRHAVKAEARLMWLTAAIVALSVLILIVTIGK
jgi:hypothetical protein